MDQKCMNLYVTSKIDEYINNLKPLASFSKHELNEENVAISYLVVPFFLKLGRQLYDPLCWGGDVHHVLVQSPSCE